VPECAILKGCLAIMIALRHRRPVADVPEQSHVPTVRNDVIDDFSRIDSAAVIAKVIDCDRMLLQESLRRFLPSVAVTALCSSWPYVLAVTLTCA
jgi:hypothetical protein